MPRFDRFDICEAYLVLEWDWCAGGWLPERPSSARRMQSIDVQLSRMKFTPRPDLCYRVLTDNGKEIYRLLEERYGFTSTESYMEKLH